MALSLETNSPSDLNMDPVLYITYLHNGTGQELFFPALSAIQLCLLLVFFFGCCERSRPCTQRFPKSTYSPPVGAGKPCTQNPAKWPSQDEARCSLGCFSKENCVCKTLLGDRKRNGNNTTAGPGHKYLLKGAVTALPSAVLLYIHRSVNTVIVFCTTPFAVILQLQIHQCSIRLLKMLRKSCSGEAAGAITQHPHTRTHEHSSASHFCCKRGESRHFQQQSSGLSLLWSKSQHPTGRQESRSPLCFPSPFSSSLCLPFPRCRKPWTPAPYQRYWEAEQLSSVLRAFEGAAQCGNSGSRRTITRPRSRCGPRDDCPQHNCQLHSRWRIFIISDELRSRVNAAWFCSSST